MENKNIGIYSITNVINGKRYIGQSTNIKQRWQKHLSDYQNPNAVTYEYPVYRAIRKYGLEYFDFQILENCDAELLNEREIYWIESYDAINSGYNQSLGGSSSAPIKLKDGRLEELTNDLRDSNLTRKEIAEKYNISTEMVSGINTGRYWHRNIDYPIRKKIVRRNENGLLKKDCGCLKCGCKVSRSKTKYCNVCFSLEKSKNIPSKEILLEDIIKMSLLQVGRKYGVSDKAVVKWCKKYDLPYKYHDIKKLRESLK